MARKIFWFGILTLILIFGMSLVGCSGNKQALVGRWVEKNRGWEMDFLSDGTGIVDEQRITWKIEGNRLYIIAVSSFGDIFGDNGSYEYRLSGSELTLIYSGGNETYVKR